MKKISILTISVLVISIVIMAFTFNTNEVPAPRNTQQNIHVYGCPDCSQLYYCIDGNAPVQPGSCEFSIDCSEGQHYICVKCSYTGDAGGGLWFTCGAQDMLEIHVGDIKNCDCGSKKK